MTSTNASLPSSPLSSPPPSPYLDFDLDESNYEPSINDPPRKNARFRRPRSLQAKTDMLNAILDVLGKHGCTFGQLLTIWTDDSKNTGITLSRSEYKVNTPDQRRNEFETFIRSYQKQSELDSIVPRVLLKELNSIPNLPFFGVLDRQDESPTFDFEKIEESLLLTAPSWCEFLRRLLRNPRKLNHEDVENKTISIKDIYCITSMICHGRNPRVSRYLAEAMDFYLLSSGVKRRVFSVLSGMGLCHSYKAALQRTINLAEEAKVEN